MKTTAYDRWCLSLADRRKRQGAPPVAESCSEHGTSRVPGIGYRKSRLYIM